MDQTKKIFNIKDAHEGQFQYLGRWADKKNFRAFVYNEKGEQRLANSYDEFISLTTNGIWFESKPTASKERKRKHDFIQPAS